MRWVGPGLVVCVCVCVCGRSGRELKRERDDASYLLVPWVAAGGGGYLSYKPPLPALPALAPLANCNYLSPPVGKSSFLLYRAHVPWGSTLLAPRAIRSRYLQRTDQPASRQLYSRYLTPFPSYHLLS